MMDNPYFALYMAYRAEELIAVLILSAIGAASVLIYMLFRRAWPRWELPMQIIGLSVYTILMVSAALFDL